MEERDWKETDTLIQSTLIITREESIIIASSQTQSCATNFAEERQREREREKEGKEQKH